MDYADAGTVPYSPAQVVANAYQLLFATRIFTDGCRHWNSKTAADKTWANFKNHFAQEHREWKETQPTSAGATYHSANSLLPEPTFLPLNKTAESLALLADATASDWETYSNLAATVTALNTQLSDANQNLTFPSRKTRISNAYLAKCNSGQQQGTKPGVDAGKEVEAEEADKSGAKANTIVGRMVTMQGMQVSAAATPAKDTFVTAPP